MKNQLTYIKTKHLNINWENLRNINSPNKAYILANAFIPYDDVFTILHISLQIP